MPDVAPQPAGTGHEQARRFVVNSLAARAQSVAEIERKLAARGVPADVAEAVIVEARELGYLDDIALAGQLARGFRTRGYGRRRASVALRRRGLVEEDADRALDEAFGDADELELARRALGSRTVADPAARRRAVAFLVRRGFSSDAAWRAVREPSDH
jgi:regulatory protein